MAASETPKEFEFDPALTPEANSELFFDFLEEENPEFAALLRENIGPLLAPGGSRPMFSEKIKAALDAQPTDGGHESVMSRYFLTRLQIEGFRGINNEGSPLDLKFKPDAVNSIWGQNGLGKSSIFEAICFALRGDIPKLEALERTEQAELYYCNRFHSVGAATVSLTFSPDDDGSDVVVTVKRGSDGVRTVSSPTGESNPDDFLKSLSEDFVLLDYAQFSKFVEDSALERGRTFSSLLGMAHLSQVRQTLAQVSNARGLATDFSVEPLKNREKALEADVRTALLELGKAHEKFFAGPLGEEADHEDIVSRATRALSEVELLKAELLDHDLMTVDFAKVGTKLKQAEGGAERKRLTDIIRDITLLEADSTKPVEELGAATIGAVISAYEVAIAETRGEKLQRVYKAVENVIDSGEWTTTEICPACESQPKQPPLDFVRSRLKSYEVAARKKVEIAQAWQGSELRKRLIALEQLGPLGLSPEAKQSVSLNRTFGDGTAKADSLDLAAKAVTELEAKKVESLTALKKEKKEVQDKLPPSLVSLTETVEHGRQLRQALLAHTKAKNELAKGEGIRVQIKRRESWVKFIKNASDVFAKAEARFSTAQTEALQADYQQMYSSIVRAPSVLPVMAKRANSENLDLKLDKFFDLADLAARPLLSESYKNAFAISVFMSAALRKTCKARFMILDDVTSSFDGGHQFNLMELIRTQVSVPENSEGLQVIILSHDGLMRKYFDGQPGEVSWRHQELRGCSPKGMVFSGSIQVDRLRAEAERFLESGMVEQAEPFMRQFLEYKLLQIIKKVQIPVPLDFAIRDEKRMAGNCLKAIMAAIDLHEKAGTLILDAEQRQILKARIVPAIVGNWVSHYETAAAGNFASNVLLGVLTDIEELVGCFQFDDTEGDSTVRRFYKSLSRRT